MRRPARAAPRGPQSFLGVLGRVVSPRGGVSATRVQGRQASTRGPAGRGVFQAPQAVRSAVGTGLWTGGQPLNE